MALKSHDTYNTDDELVERKDLYNIAKDTVNLLLIILIAQML